MEQENKQASLETKRYVLQSLDELLSNDGFLLDNRRIIIPDYLRSDFDIQTVTISYSPAKGATVCHVRRCETQESPWRDSVYYAYDDGRVKGFTVEIPYTDDEKSALAVHDCVEQVWFDELLRLDQAGLLDTEAELEHLQATLSMIGEYVRRASDARKLRDSAETQQERLKAGELLRAIDDEIQSARMVDAAARQKGALEAGGALGVYAERYHDLIKSYANTFNVRAETLIRAMSETVKQSKMLDDETSAQLTEPEAWTLIRLLDKLQDF